MSKSTMWFLAILAVLAVVAIGVTLLLVTLLAGTGEGTETLVSGSGDRVAVVELRGVIESSEDVVRQLKKHREARGIRAVLLRVDSPGGGVVASQEIYEAVRKTREAKPVVVSMGALAASGGYYVACGGSRIVANRGTLTGSIGVISEFLQLSDVLGKIGIDVKTVKAGRMKDAGSPTRKMSAEAERYFQSLVDDVHGQFMAVVGEERKIERSRLLGLADGRVFTGEQALGLGLVDTLGTFEDAVRIAADLAGIAGEPSLVRERKRSSWWETMVNGLGESIAGVRRELIDRPILSYRFTGP